MLSRRVLPAELAGATVNVLEGAVLLAPIKLTHRSVAKGTRIDTGLAVALIAAARDGALTAAPRLAWPEPGDLHENDAACRLAVAAAGRGVEIDAPHQSRIDLRARWDGVLRVKIGGLSAVNRIDPLELFTLFHSQSVRGGQVVASVKVAPHLVAGAAVAAGEAVAREHAPLVDVDPYLPLEVAAVAAEPLGAEGLARFDAAARSKITALGGRFIGCTHVSETEPADATSRIDAILRDLTGSSRVPLILVGGVSAGDPLSPFYAALEALDGRLLRRGVPAHPGSMIWLADLAGSTILGLPQCGMFSMATAADLVLPRLLTGERVTPDTLADLGHGGLLGKEMRFRFPDYARDLESPGGE